MNNWEVLSRLATTPRATILYVGANVGQHIPALRGISRGGHIYAFEPDRRAYATLAEKFGQDNDVTLIPLAVADRAEPRQFYVNESSVTSSLLPWNPGSLYRAAHYRTAQIATVPTTTLDQFCLGMNTFEIELLFMDVQGGELLALHGAAGLLRCPAIKLIYGEVLFCDIYEGAPSFCDIYSYVTRYGYEFYGFFNCKLRDDGRWKWADFLFTRRGG